MAVPKAVIFDMDGVLVDSEPLHVMNEKQMFGLLKLDVSEEEHAGYMGVASDVMWRDIIAKRDLPWSVGDLMRFSAEHCHPFFENLEKIDPMPGLIELLEKLKNHEIPVAVASSSDAETIGVILRKSGLENYFKVKLSSGQVGKSKPEPDVFLHAAIHLEVEPADCIVIEDSRNGIKAAKAAGMFCIAYSGANSGYQDQSQADAHIKHFNELHDLDNWIKNK